MLFGDAKGALIKFPTSPAIPNLFARHLRRHKEGPREQSLIHVNLYLRVCTSELPLIGFQHRLPFLARSLPFWTSGVEHYLSDDDEHPFLQTVPAINFDLFSQSI